MSRLAYIKVRQCGARAPGPGSLWVLAVLTSPAQCGQVRTGWVTCPHTPLAPVVTSPPSDAVVTGAGRVESSGEPP